MSDQQRTERGAAETASGTPMTETERDASRRPPSEPGAGRDGADDGNGSGAGAGDR
jgi:hypothetical protein